MKLRELALVVCGVAVSVALWRGQAPAQAPVATETRIENLQTETGATHIEAGPFAVAGIRPGMSQVQVRAMLGEPVIKDGDWAYSNDEGQLSVTFDHGAVLAVGGPGRWALTRKNEGLPAFMSTEAEVRQALGEPGRTDQNALVYTNLPGELTFQFDAQRRVSQVYLVGLLHPIPARNPAVLTTP